MQQLARKISAEIGWGIPSSIILHLLLAFVLLVRLPELPTAQEQSVNVELVPPPPPAEEKPKPAEDKPAPAEQQVPAQKLAFESASNDPKDETPEQPDIPPATAEAKEEQPLDSQQDAAEPDAQSATAENANGIAAPAIENPPVPQPKPEQEKPAVASQQQAKNFKQARRLYSKDALSDPRVKQALGKLSPTDRVIQICSIEALEQIRHQQPGAFPDMLARAGGSVSGTGLTVSNGAFRSRAQWYGVDFKCQVNAEAMSIQSFSYAIGHAIPESEWSARQLPRD